MGARRDSGTAEKKRLFLAEYVNHGTVYHACKAADVGRSTVYRWRDDDPAFAADMDACREESTDVLEDSLYDRAVKNDTTAAIFLLKGRRREVYGDRQELTGPDGGPVQLTVTVIDSRRP